MVEDVCMWFLKPRVHPSVQGSLVQPVPVVVYPKSFFFFLSDKHTVTSMQKIKTHGRFGK